MSQPKPEKPHNPDWPGYGTRMTLKQLGVPAETIREAVELYRAHHPEPEEKAFLAWCLDHHHKDRLPEPNVALLPLDWQPSTDAICELYGEGYEEPLLNHARDTFLINYRRLAKALLHTHRAFTSYCRRHYPLHGHFREGVWIPGKGTLVTLNLEGFSEQTVRTGLGEYQSVIAAKGRIAATHCEFCEFMHGWFRATS